MIVLVYLELISGGIHNQKVNFFIPSVYANEGPGTAPVVGKDNPQTKDNVKANIEKAKENSLNAATLNLLRGSEPIDPQDLEILLELEETEPELKGILQLQTDSLDPVEDTGTSVDVDNSVPISPLGIKNILATELPRASDWVHKKVTELDDAFEARQRVGMQAGAPKKNSSVRNFFSRSWDKLTGYFDSMRSGVENFFFHITPIAPVPLNELNVKPTVNINLPDGFLPEGDTRKSWFYPLQIFRKFKSFIHPPTIKKQGVINEQAFLTKLTQLNEFYSEDRIIDGAIGPKSYYGLN
ncbi:hypothetical protein BdWA1_000995 [Babesia duncani]|uniref:Uncharacterized protein n=1 Tax=Babesia duncani TaxID=323732 RepID=A0AAD9PNU1_9APIC|nr:hypothetical protein BdWA1_000995 [Babesia duncani]